MKDRISAGTLATDLLFDLMGCTLVALGIAVFQAPNNIAPGGVSGIAILVNYLTQLPISVVSLCINLPLLVLAFLFLGRNFTLRTLKTVLVFTGALAVVEAYVPVYQGERILAALSGGVLMGIGLALIFMRSSTTGGTDILARLIQRRYPDLAVGRLMMIIDMAVLLGAVLVYRNLESALFALVSIFTRTRIMDSILFGRDMGKVLMVVSEQPQAVAKAIGDRLRRGCTLLDAKGSYTLQERPVLLCVVRKNQYYELKKTIHDIDPHSFLIAMEASEIIGQGFKEFDPA